MLTLQQVQRTDQTYSLEAMKGFISEGMYYLYYLVWNDRQCHVSWPI